MVRKYLKWRYIRWAIAIPTLPAALWACTSHPLMQPKPAPEQDTNIYINVNPSRKLDLVFLIDNSLSMLPKQQKLEKQFPKLIDALKDPDSNPPLPDLRIAIVNSDLGTGSSARCTPQYGAKGAFQMPGAKECGVFDNATFLEYEQGKNVNFGANLDIAKVFGCLATKIGTGGCGFEQQLQSINWAFNLDVNKSQKENFIRQDAYLGIVILTDEDDCSTEIKGMLAHEKDITQAENWSLRCSTRGHQCSGANLTYPTTASFDKDFTACKAREDFCDPEKELGEKPTSCSPLASIKGIAKSIKDLKLIGKTQDIEKFLVAGIFGWPIEGQTNPRYKIEKAPNVTAGQPDLYDYWPVCYDPDHPMPAAGPADRANFDLAFGWGGFGGLRVKAFLEEFPEESSLAFSICERDFSKAMSNIGAKLAAKLKNLCIGYKLLDTDADNEAGTIKGEPGVQADCRVVDRSSGTDKNGQLEYKESEAMERCDKAGDARPCWRVKADEIKCPAIKDGKGKVVVPSQLIEVVRLDKVPPPTDTKVGMKCRTCANLSDDLTDLYQVPGCKY